MQSPKQSNFLVKSTKDHVSDVSDRISNIYMRIYRKTFRILPVCSYAFDINSLNSGVGVRVDFDNIPCDSLDSSLHSDVSRLDYFQKNNDTTMFHRPTKEKDSTTFKINFWDKTVIKFNFKNDRLVGLFISLSLPLVIFLSWLILSLINFWIFYDVNFRSEWALLFILSLIPFYRAAKSSIYDLFSLLFIHLILDAAAGTIVFHVYPHVNPLWMSVIFDFFMFTNTIGSLQGFCLGTWFYVFVFTYVNYSMKGQLATSGLSWFISIHAVGHAAYLGLGELLVQIILLRNRNFSDPLFSLDKSEMIHKFRYLGLSGKLEVVSSEEELLDRSSLKNGKRKHPIYHKKTSSKLKLPLDNKSQSHDSLVLRPSVGEIVDSFDICISDIGSNYMVIQWAVPISFLYLLAKCSVFIKEFDERDRSIASISSSLSVTDFDNSVSEGEVLRKIDITLRVNGSIWDHWIINKDYNAITISNLHPHTNHAISMSVIGFRSATTYATTLPVELKYNSGLDTEIVSFENKIKQLIVLEESVYEERKLKKDELNTIKKIRRHLAQQEVYFSQSIQEVSTSIERAKQDEEKIEQCVQNIQQSIQVAMDRIIKSKEFLSKLSDDIKVIEPKTITINYQASCLHSALLEAKEDFKKLNSVIQKDTAIWNKERNNLLVNSNKIEKQLSDLKKVEIAKAKSKIVETELNIIKIQEEISQAHLRSAEILNFSSDVHLKLIESENISEKLCEDASLGSDLNNYDFLVNLSSHISKLNHEIEDAESLVLSYREAVDSEVEFVGRLENEKSRIISLLEHRKEKPELI